MLKLSARMGSWNQVVIFSGFREIGVAHLPVECRIEFIALLNAATEMREALKEITKAEGRFSPIPLRYAENMIANMAQIARDALAKVKGAT